MSARSRACEYMLNAIRLWSSRDRVECLSDYLFAEPNYRRAVSRHAEGKGPPGSIIRFSLVPT